MSKLKIINSLTEILKELAEEDAFVIANSVQVLKWAEALPNIEGRYALVQVSQASELYGTGSGCWRVLGAYHSLSHMGEDKSRVSCNELYEELGGLLTNMTPANCNGTDAHTNSGLTIDGIIDREESDTVIGNYWQQSIQAVFFMQVVTI